MFATGRMFINSSAPSHGSTNLSPVSERGSCTTISFETPLYSSRQNTVIVESDDVFLQNSDNLNSFHFRNDGGNLLPFETVATVRETLGPTLVYHMGNLPSVSIFFNLHPSYPFGKVMEFITQAAAKIIPNHINGSLEGETKTFKEVSSHMVVMLILAIFVMYIILGIIYESYIHPLTVLSALPVAMVGGC
jgi:HAE1 family hydrophobic/amphiphilic exporter-1